MSTIHNIIAVALSLLACATLGRRTSILHPKWRASAFSQALEDSEASSVSEIGRTPLHALGSVLAGLKPSSGFRTSFSGLHWAGLPARAGNARLALASSSEQDRLERVTKDFDDRERRRRRNTAAGPSNEKSYIYELEGRQELERRHVLVAGFAAMAALSAAPAYAGLGSSRAAVTSFPGAPKRITGEIFADLSATDQERLESVLPSTEITEFLSELQDEKLKLEAQLEALIQEDENQSENLKKMTSKLESTVQQLKETRASIAEVDSALAAKNATKPEGRAQQASRKRELDELAKQKKILEGRFEKESQERVITEQRLQMQIEMSKSISQSREASQKIREQLDRNKKGESRLAARSAKLQALDAQPTWFNYAAAFVASCVSTLIMLPVDTIKTRLLVAGTERRDGDDEPSNPIQAWLSLYKGVGGALLKEGPPSAVYLGIYEAAKAALLANPTFAPFPLLVFLLAGALGEVAGSLIRSPAEAIKARVQAGVDNTFTEAVDNVLGDEVGRERVIRAWSSGLLRDVPFGGIQLAIFEGLKEYIATSQSTIDFDPNSLAAEVLFGALGGGISAFLTTPGDLITTRIITSDDEDSNVFSMAAQVVEDEGWPALFTGWKERTLLWTPSIGIFLSVYCLIRGTAIQQGFFPLA